MIDFENPKRIQEIRDRVFETGYSFYAVHYIAGVLADDYNPGEVLDSEIKLLRAFDCHTRAYIDYAIKMLLEQGFLRTDGRQNDRHFIRTEKRDVVRFPLLSAPERNTTNPFRPAKKKEDIFKWVVDPEEEKKRKERNAFYRDVKKGQKRLDFEDGKFNS